MSQECKMRTPTYHHRRRLHPVLCPLTVVFLAIAAHAPFSSGFVVPQTTQNSHSFGLDYHDGPGVLAGKPVLPSRMTSFPRSTVSPTRPSTTELNGIPKMFRWLTDQYPNINRRLADGLTTDIAVDNFYLDMNGIIHPCTHGNAEGKIIVLDETAMFKKIFSYVDRLYKLVGPRKVLYLAVDGVAPRAKMNQQRSRRFRSAKEAEQTAMEVLAREGKLPEGKQFDSNCITPGTDFMLKLSLAMKKWVQFKMETDPFWAKGAHVIVSGPDVPGEGEHKVMDFIREQKELYANTENPDERDDNVFWGPEWTHVLYGLDADLIMLGLVTHEPNFMLLREKMSVVMAGRGRNKNRKKKDMMEYDQNDFEVLELSSLLQLLTIQFRRFADEGVLKVPYSIERVIDDFVFMCMLVGNDFLPHTPHLEIDNGAISLMITSYIDLLPEWGGYLTDKEKIHPDRFEQFMYNLAAFEEEHFKRRGFEENEPGWKLTADTEEDEGDFYGQFYGGDPTPPAAVEAATRGSYPPVLDKDETAAAGSNVGGATNVSNEASQKDHPGDCSRSYRDYYYASKMGWPYSDRDRTLFQRRALVRDYLEGLHWNLNYYHNGCQSWDWFFPHLYAPLATDMVNLREFYQPGYPGYDEDPDSKEEGEQGFVSFPFESGIKFPPLAQLLSVLPPQSAELLPAPLGELMVHPSSPLIEFYPRDFTSDPNGKRQPWEAVVQIPFIEASVLLDTVNSVLDKDAEKAKEDEEGLLTKGERMRNAPGSSAVIRAPDHGTITLADREQQLTEMGGYGRKDYSSNYRGSGRGGGGGRSGGRGSSGGGDRGRRGGGGGRGYGSNRRRR